VTAMYNFSPVAWTALLSSSACATTSNSSNWLWIPLGGFALISAATALLRILVRSEA
jgi:hypothetical protein